MKKTQPKEVIEVFETPIVKVDGKPFGFNEKINRPYLPKGLEMIAFNSQGSDDKKMIIEVHATRKEINELKQDKKLKWLKR